MAPISRRHSEYGADGIGPLPTRAHLQIYTAHHNLSSTTVSSVVSYYTDSTGVLSQPGTRFDQDFGRTMNSGFGVGCPGRKGPREGRERGVPGMLSEYGPGRTGKAPAPMPESLLFAFGLEYTEQGRRKLEKAREAEKESAIAEVVMRHLDKERRDAEDGEIKAAVDDLVESVEYWSERIRAWHHRRKLLGSEEIPCTPLHFKTSEIEKTAIRMRISELKEDIVLLEAQPRAKEVHGATISRCATNVQEMAHTLMVPISTTMKWKQRLALDTHTERLDHLKERTDILDQAIEQAQATLRQPNKKTFSLIAEQLRARVVALRVDLNDIPMWIYQTKNEVPSELHAILDEYESLGKGLFAINSRVDPMLLAVEELEKGEQAPNKLARMNPLYTMSQMSWMKPMLPQREPKGNGPGANFQQEEAPSSGDTTIVVEEETGADISEDSDGWESVSGASEHSRYELSIEEEIDTQLPDPKTLNALKSAGLCYWHEQEGLKQEVSMLEGIMAQLSKEETAPLFAANMTALTKLLYGAVTVRKDIPKAPGMRRLSENLQSINGEVSAMIRSLLFAEHEQIRRERQKNAAIKYGVKNEDQRQSILQPLSMVTLRPEAAGRDSGCFDGSSLEEEYAIAIQECELHKRKREPIILKAQGRQEYERGGSGDASR